MNKTKTYNADDNRRASSMFDQALSERSEPIGVFRALQTACERKCTAVKSEGTTVTTDEYDWLAAIKAEAEATIAAINTVLAGDVQRQVRQIQMKHLRWKNDNRLQQLQAKEGR